MFGRKPDGKIEMLRGVAPFRAFSNSDLQNVGRHVDEAHRKAGDVLARQDERGSEMLVLVSGAARVDRDGTELAILGPGDVVGELSLIDDQPRSATVTATEDCEILVMHRNDFKSLMSEVPGFTAKVLESVTQRLREADQRLVV